MKRKRPENPSNASSVKNDTFDTKKDFRNMDEITQAFLIICLTAQIIWKL